MVRFGVEGSEYRVRLLGEEGLARRELVAMPAFRGLVSGLVSGLLSGLVRAVACASLARSRASRTRCRACVQRFSWQFRSGCDMRLV